MAQRLNRLVLASMGFLQSGRPIGMPSKSNFCQASHQMIA